ncbi:MAG: putative DNA modification/repair radical SAM protein [Candidatus Hodarchaeota archaeon]
MSFLDKLKILGASAKYDLCASTASTRTANRPISNQFEIGKTVAGGICHSFTPDGRCVSLFKVLLTNRCSNDCAYCNNRCGRDCPRVSFEPEELSRIFTALYERNYVEGLFLSSGVPGDPERVMEKTLDVVELLRNRYRFNGYVHLKIMPGSNYDQVKHACEIADRISLNVETPSQSRLSELSSTKNLKTDILKRMEWAKSFADKGRMCAPAGQTTQFVVGPAGESDLEILQMMEQLYSEQMRLRRVYFSAFDPVPGTPLEKVPKTPLAREVRLYQADFLYRRYNFSFRELKTVLNDNDMFDLSVDVKLVYALQNPELYPVEINDENTILENLLKVPGIGPRSAGRILDAKRAGFRFSKLKELARLGVVVKRARPFLEINGCRQAKLDEMNVYAWR